jgi:hypothetical protein
MLAMAYEFAAQFDLAEEQLRASMKLDSIDLMPILGLAALRLRHGTDPTALAAAIALLDWVGRRLPKDSNPEPRWDYLATQGIYLGLKGDVAEASRLFRQVPEQDSEHRMASETLHALGE